MCSQLNRFRLYGIALLLTIILSIQLSLNVVAQMMEMEDGTYTMDYVILRGDNDSVSIANDYFEKPATLIVENGEQYIQFWINHSQWVKELQSPLGEEFVDVDIVEENEEEDLRLVQFRVARDLNEPIEFKMHVYIDSLEPVYDHRYSVRFDFDLDSLQETEAKEIFHTNNEDDSSESEEAIALQNSNDSDNSSISITMTIVIVIAIILFTLVIWKFIKNKSNRKVNTN